MFSCDVKKFKDIPFQIKLIDIEIFKKKKKKRSRFFHFNYMEKTYSLHLQEILGCRDPYYEAPSAQVCADVNARGASMIPGFLNAVVQVRKLCWINVLHVGFLHK